MKAIKAFLALLVVITTCFMAFWWTAATHSTNSTRVLASTTSDQQNEQAAEQSQPVIVLDAGHGGYDSGSLSQSGVQEKNITLALALLVGERLEAEGIKVLYTRTSDEVSWENDNLSDLQTRVSIAEDAQANYYISIHTNFSAYQDGAFGFESYLNEDDDVMIAMAQQIHKNLAALQFSTDRGIKSTEDSSLYVIDHNLVPALLLEVGFLSDSDDAWYLINEQEQLADAIADGILASV